MDFLGLPAVSGLGTTGFPATAGAHFGFPTGASQRCCAAGAGSSDPTTALLAGQLAMTQTLLNVMLLLLLQLMQGKGGKGGVGALQDLAGGPGGGGTGSASGASSSGASSSGGAGTAYDPSAAGSNVARPNGYNGIVAAFGQPGDRSNLVTVDMPAGPGGKMIPVTVHKKIAGKLKAAFEEIKARGLSGEIKSFDGTFNPRKKRGGSTWSTHAWGIAVDINAGLYPMGTPVSQTSEGHKQIAAILARYGFHQLPNDPHHFQYATGY